MSHLATVETKIFSLAALERAAAKCGLVMLKQDRFRWYGAPEQCEYALSIPANADAYQIGVCRVENREQDEWCLRYDSFSGGRGMQAHVATQANPGGLGRLLSAYAYEVEIETAQANGFMVQEQEQEDGSLLLVCTR